MQPHGKSTKAISILELIQESVSSRTALSNISQGESSTPFRVLISTMLSARTRDRVTEEASARLFTKYPDARALMVAKCGLVSRLIKPVSFYRVKARRIIKIAEIIEEKYRGRVPQDMDELLSLPGVGRKTANCVLVYAFNTPAIPVDVHVHRVSNRIGLVNTKTPERTEEELAKLYERRYWLQINESFVKFGQTICRPGVPLCRICKVKEQCNYYKAHASSGKKGVSEND